MYYVQNTVAFSENTYIYSWRGFVMANASMLYDMYTKFFSMLLCGFYIFISKWDHGIASVCLAKAAADTF